MNPEIIISEFWNKGGSDKSEPSRGEQAPLILKNGDNLKSQL